MIEDHKANQFAEAKIEANGALVVFDMDNDGEPSLIVDGACVPVFQASKEQKLHAAREYNYDWKGHPVKDRDEVCSTDRFMSVTDTRKLCLGGIHHVEHIQQIERELFFANTTEENDWVSGRNQWIAKAIGVYPAGIDQIVAEMYEDVQEQMDMFGAIGDEQATHEWLSSAKALEDEMRNAALPF